MDPNDPDDPSDPSDPNDPDSRGAPTPDASGFTEVPAGRRYLWLSLALLAGAPILLALVIIGLLISWPG